MTLDEAVTRVQRILALPFPPGYIDDQARCADLLTEEGALQGLADLTVVAEAAMDGVDAAGQSWQTPALVLVTVRLQAAPQCQYAYPVFLDDLDVQDDDTVRAGWLFSLVRAVERSARGA